MHVLEFKVVLDEHRVRLYCKKEDEAFRGSLMVLINDMDLSHCVVGLLTTEVSQLLTVCKGDGHGVID